MKFNLNEITLTVNYVRYPHTAQHITESLEEILKEWNLCDKVFTITTDNAANMKRAIANMKNISWQGCSAHTIQLIVEKALVPVKVLIARVKRLIEFFMRPKQSERLEDIQKKYPNVNSENDENLDEREKEIIVVFLLLFIFNKSLIYIYNITNLIIYLIYLHFTIILEHERYG
jgi:hypothetical protein